MLSLIYSRKILSPSQYRNECGPLFELEFEKFNPRSPKHYMCHMSKWFIKCAQCVFAISRLSATGNEHDPFEIPLHLYDLCQVWLKLTQSEDENVKIYR